MLEVLVQAKLRSQSLVMDAKGKKAKRARERYARMTYEEKHEKLKKRREVYQHNKNSTKFEERCARKRQQYANMQPEQNKARIEQGKPKKGHEVYQHKTNSTRLHERCARMRKKYANMQPEQKKARIEQVTANRLLKCSAQAKDTIAMENPGYIATYMSSKVNQFILNVKHRKQVMPSERQTLLAQCNEKIMRKWMTTMYASSEKDTSMMKKDINAIDSLTQPEVKNNGNTIYIIFSYSNIEYTLNVQLIIFCWQTCPHCIQPPKT